MVASYSPTLSKRSHSVFTGIIQSIQGVKNAIASDHNGPFLSAIEPTTSPQTQLIEQLAALPGNTFGHQWSQLMSQDHSSKAEEQSLMSGLHVLTGYENNIIGQLELHAFLFGATGHVLFFAQCMGMILSLPQENEHSMPMKKGAVKAYEAYQRGRASHFTMNAWQPELLWDLPTPYVRQWFGLSA